MPGALPLCACEVVLPPRPLPKSSTGSAGDRQVPERERQLQDARDQPDTCKGKEEGRVQEPAKASGRDTPERRGRGGIAVRLSYHVVVLCRDVSDHVCDVVREECREL